MTQFFSEPKVLACLNSARANLKMRRQMRSERRESVVQVMSALLHYTDLATMRVGIYSDKGFQPLGVRFFVKLTGLSQSRFEEALGDINAAGLITTHARCRKNKAGQYVGLNAIRAVSPKLFDVFGLGKWLSKVRKKCSARLLARAEKLSIANFINITMVLAGNKPNSKFKKSKSPSSSSDTTQNGNKPTHPNIRTLREILSS